MSEELKPCPFCGSAKIHIHKIEGGFSENGITYYAYCYGCGCEMGASRTETGVAEQWNRRIKE